MVVLNISISTTVIRFEIFELYTTAISDDFDFSKLGFLYADHP